MYGCVDEWVGIVGWRWMCMRVPPPPVFFLRFFSTRRAIPHHHHFPLFVIVCVCECSSRTCIFVRHFFFSKGCTQICEYNAPHTFPHPAPHPCKAAPEAGSRRAFSLNIYIFWYFAVLFLYFSFPRDKHIHVSIYVVHLLFFQYAASSFGVVLFFSPFLF